MILLLRPAVSTPVAHLYGTAVPVAFTYIGYTRFEWPSTGTSPPPRLLAAAERVLVLHLCFMHEFVVWFVCERFTVVTRVTSLDTSQGRMFHR